LAGFHRLHDAEQKRMVGFLISAFVAYADAPAVQEASDVAGELLGEGDERLQMAGAVIVSEVSRLGRWAEVAQSRKSDVAERLDRLTRSTDALVASKATEALAPMDEFGEAYALKVFSEPFGSRDGYTAVYEHVSRACEIFVASPRLSTLGAFLKVGRRLGEIEGDEYKQLLTFYYSQLEMVREGVHEGGDRAELASAIDEVLARNP